MGVPQTSGCRGLLVLLVFCAIAGGVELPAEAPGPYFPLEGKGHAGTASFKLGQPIVGTSYFYWYDIDSKGHIIDHDGTDALTTHPADINGISYKRASWHKQQLADMIEAGVDFLLPVFWGVPGKYEGWSFAGLPPLVEAHNALKREGKTPPAIGLFYDTSILLWNGFNEDGSSRHIDLSTDFGKAWFYAAMRDFFSYIPPAKWARIDGRPIVFFYTAAFAKGQDPQQFVYVKKRFKEDFGIEPFIVKSQDWQGQADAAYSWGGAVSGPLIFQRVVALGPGYDHSAVPGRTSLIVERLDGKTYVDRWAKVLRLSPERRPWIVHVETWNEWHEGTDVAHSREYGRQYIVLTRLFADMWHAKTNLRPLSPYGDAASVVWELGGAKGLELRDSGEDGVWNTVEVGGIDAAVSAPNPHSQNSRYLYFNVDDAFAFELYDGSGTVAVRYRDAGCSSFHIEYDSTSTEVGAHDGAFRPVGNVKVGESGESGEWKTATFALEQCRFMNRCNGTDFRIVVVGGEMELVVRKVTLSRRKGK